MNIEFGVVEDDAVEENPEGAAASYEKGLPPPMVILLAEHNVRCHDRHLHNGQDPHKADYTEEAENVIITTFVLPEAAENKE